MAIRIQDRDRGYKAMRRQIDEMKRIPKIGVGVVGDDGIEFIASVHEFGLGVPQRSFIRAWFDENLPSLREDIIALGHSVFSHRAYRQLAVEYGERYVGQIRDRILRHIAPELAESTVAAKERRGSASPTTPLVGTGRLIDSIHALINGKAV